MSSNFSVNGLFIKTRRTFAPGTVLNIVIHLPNGATSKVKGAVKRAPKTPTGRIMGTPVKVVKDGMGVEIIEKDAQYLHVIKTCEDMWSG